MNRCLLVSNRLPITYDESSQCFRPSSGGLVSAIKGLNPTKVGYNFEWMGAITDDIDEEKIRQLKKEKFGDIKCHPILIPRNSYHTYYNKYCNNVIWPLFHYERSLVHHSPSGWKQYQNVNKLFAEAIIQEAKAGDTIWVHDFQLMLVPGYVKEKRSDLKIGFFLHIPFPSSEIFRELPQRKEILNSLLKCDLVGFHDYSYLTHFKTSVTRILGEIPDTATERKWGVYPISIDTRHFIQLRDHPETLKVLKKYKESKKDMKWVLGVDRLDYIKGLVLKFRSFKDFLRKNPLEVGKVQMVQIVIPSRTDVPEYLMLKERIEQIVSSINGEFGNPSYTPILYLYHSVSEYELSSLYQLSEVLHIGSRRDGMNLVSLEYVASQRSESAGTILMSEFAGAHSTLSYAYSINPWDIEGTSKIIQEALLCPKELKEERMQFMQHFLMNYNASDWAQVFLRDLHQHITSKEKTIPVTSANLFNWMQSLNDKKILFFCDLDGTLLPIADHPSKVKMRERTEMILNQLANNDQFQFIIVSGRDKEFLQKQFINRNLNFSLAACHGAYAYLHQENKWIDMVPVDSSKWRETVMEIFKIYTIRTPGSFIEDKGQAVTWHYRNSPTGFADFLANKLFTELEDALSNQPVQVMRGKKVIEVKSIHANKGMFVQQWLRDLPPEQSPDIIIAMGDDTTDEDMFMALQEQKEIDVYCIKVGNENTSARYYIKDQQTVDPLLENILKGLEAQEFH